MISSLRPVLAGLVLCALAACGKHDHDTDHAAKGGHAHAAPHGGTLVELGEHAYNLEFLRDAASGKLMVWVLDGHAENFVRIKATAIDLAATINGAPRRLTLQAVANSATGETIGDTSQFEVQADWLKAPAGFQGVIASLEVRGHSFAGITFTVPAAAP